MYVYDMYIHIKSISISLVLILIFIVVLTFTLMLVLVSLLVGECGREAPRGAEPVCESLVKQQTYTYNIQNVVKQQTYKYIIQNVVKQQSYTYNIQIDQIRKQSYKMFKHMFRVNTIWHMT